MDTTIFNVLTHNGAGPAALVVLAIFGSLFVINCVDKFFDVVTGKKKKK